MITEKDLREAIAECEGERNPNANTCMKLAAFYIIRNEMFGTPVSNDIPVEYNGYSGSVGYNSGTEFSDMIKGKDFNDVIPLMDELMESVKIVLPRLYDSVINRLRNI